MNLTIPYCESMLVGEMWFLEDRSICHHLQAPNFQPWATRASIHVFPGSKRGGGMQGEVTEVMH